MIYNAVLASGVYRYRCSVIHIPTLSQILFPYRLLQNRRRVPTSWFSEMKWWPCKFPWTPPELSGPGSGHCTLPSKPFRMNSGESAGTRQESRWGTLGRRLSLLPLPPFYLPWVVATGCHDPCFFECWVLVQFFQEGWVRVNEKESSCWAETRPGAGRRLREKLWGAETTS